MARARFLMATLALTASMAAAATAPWHHDLSHANGGYWRARAAVTVSNNAGSDAQGRPVEVDVGALEGLPVAALRVCDAEGSELLWDLLDAQGQPKREGALAKGDRLVFGIECKSRAKTSCYVYVDNPRALPVMTSDGSVGVDNQSNPWMQRSRGPSRSPITRMTIRNGGQHRDCCEPKSIAPCSISLSANASSSFFVTTLA